MGDNRNKPISPVRGPSLDKPISFEGLDLNRSDDSHHWVQMLNKPVLETTRSAANALALAAQSEANIPNLLNHMEGIVKGIGNLFQYSQDASTLFGCSVLLSKLSVNSDFCIYCADNGILSTILQGLVDWSGQGKRDISSAQILLQLTKTLEKMKKNLGHDEWIKLLSSDPE